MLTTRSLIVAALSIAFLTIASGCQKSAPSRTDLNPELRAYLDEAATQLGQIPEDRRTAIGRMADYIAAEIREDQPAKLVFICTHNSRRSHMSQAMAAAAAVYFGVSAVETYSGGTEATAFNPRAVRALREAGFTIEAADPDADNPRYALRSGPALPEGVFFSKKFEDPFNPQNDFLAVMTCSEADKTCPIVAGAEQRVALPYDDPKAFDGTPEEAAKYRERALQIAREELYLFQEVSRRL